VVAAVGAERPPVSAGAALAEPKADLAGDSQRMVGNVVVPAIRD